MAWWAVILLIFGGLLVLMLTGLPVAFCFLLINLIGSFFLWGGVTGWEQLIVSMFGSISNFALLPVPLFVLMGEVMFLSGVGPSMLATLNEWIGRVPGRLSLLAVTGGVLFSTLTGTSLASVAMLGSVLLPEMKKAGYSNAMSLGPILGSGGLAMMIPPSALAVLFGSIAEVSIGGILIAIVIPGILMAVLYAAYIIIRCIIRPEGAHLHEGPSTAFRQKILLSVKYLLPVCGIVFLVVGVIFFGIATPTEASATGAIGCFVLASIYKKVNVSLILRSAYNTLAITVMMFTILIGARAFSQIMAYTGASRGMIDFVLNFDMPPMLLVIGLQVVVLILGMFISAVPIMLITLPIFMPLVVSFGYDPLWFGVLFLINIEMASTTPPFGLSLFVIKGIAPSGTTMSEIIKSALPFLYCDAVAMGLVMAFPQLALWLPSLM